MDTITQIQSKHMFSRLSIFLISHCKFLGKRQCEAKLLNCQIRSCPFKVNIKKSLKAPNCRVSSPRQKHPFKVGAKCWKQTITTPPWRRNVSQGAFGKAPRQGTLPTARQATQQHHTNGVVGLLNGVLDLAAWFRQLRTSLKHKKMEHPPIHHFQQWYFDWSATILSMDIKIKGKTSSPTNFMPANQPPVMFLSLKEVRHVGAFLLPVEGVSRSV